ncbi:MAG TPA: hypothetical protein VI076_04575 [Actinopolymorphaceae bacterium]
MPKPRPATNLRTTSTIGRITLTWESEPYDPFVDHYAVHASESSAAPIDESTLLGKTVYPRFVHDRLGGRAQTWHYRVVVVEAAGNRSRPSAVATGTSVESVAVSGEPIATVGSFDHKGLEFALSPNGYAQYRTRFPNGPDYTFGTSDPATDWAYIHPGPADSWAGNQAWEARFRFTLETVPDAPVWLSLWLIDTHATIPGTAKLRLGGTEFTGVTFEGGATRGSLEGDATRPGSPLRPSYVELELPRDNLVAGENVLGIEKIDGSWHAYDAMGVFVTRES